MKRVAIIALFLIASAALLLPRCTRQPNSLPEENPESQLGITVVGKKNLPFFKKRFPRVSRYQITQSTEPLVIMPHADQAGESATAQAHGMVQRGHRVVLFGKRPFAKTFTSSPGVQRTYRDPSTWRPETLIKDISDIPLWTPSSKDQKIQSSVSLVKTNRVAFPLFHISFTDIQRTGWIQHASEKFLSPDTTALAFLCRSPANGMPFVIQVKTAQNNTYQCVIPALKEWQKFELRPAAFHSKEGDLPLPDFTNIVKWSIGYDQQAQRVPSGPHALEISPFFSKKAASSNEQSTPTFPFSGGAKSYDLQIEHLQSLPTPRWKTSHRPIDATSPLPSSSNNGPPYSFPLIQGRTPEGTRVAVAHQIFSGRDEGSWIWVGLDVNDLEPQALVQLIEHLDAASKPLAKCVQAYPTRYTFPPLAPIDLHVEIANLQTRELSCRLHASLQTLDGKVLNSKTSDAFNLRPSEQNYVTNLSLEGIAPLRTSRTDYRVHVELRQELGNRSPLHQLRFPIKVLPTPPEIDSRLFLHPNVNIFRVGRNAFHLHGLKYRPSQFLTEAQDWLSPKNFPADRLERDLAQIKRTGINTLHITCPNLQHPEQLLFLLQKIYQTGFLVILQLPPLSFDPETTQHLLDFLEKIKLASAPQIVTLEFSNVIPHTLGSQLDVKRAWDIWILEQLGSSVEESQTDQKSIFNSPTLYQLHVPSAHPHPRLIQAFRNDFASHRFGYLTRELRQANIHQMLTTSLSTAPEDSLPWRELTPYDVRAVAPHMDYITLSAAPGYGNREGILSQCWQGLLTRGLSGGKPLVWDHLGCRLSLPASEDMLTFHHDMHQWGLELSTRTYASGSIGPLAFDFTDQPSSTGLYAAPSDSRPALQAYKEHSNELRNHRPIPRPWKGRRFSMNYRGAALDDAILITNQLTTSDSVSQELRHEHFKKPSTTLSIAPLSPETGALLESVNAEWGAIYQQEQRISRRPSESISVQGRAPITLELLNTGMPTWSTSVEGLINTVWVEIRHANLQPKFLPLKKTDYGETASLVWHPHGYGTFKIRPLLWATGGFGEVLEVEIRLKNP